MKTILIIITILLNHLLFAQESQFRFESQDLNIKGVISTGNKIICYGDYGSILTSNDLGKTWKQTRIGDYRDTIIKLYAINNKILGFTKSGKNVVSNDNGNTWNFSQNTNIKDIQAITNDSNYIYLRERHSLKAFDFDLNLVGSVVDTLINTNYESSPKSLCSINDKLLFNSFSYDVISINKQDLLVSKVNFTFNKYIDSLKSISSIHVNNNDEIMVLYYSNKYKVNNEGIIITKDMTKYVFKNAGNIYNVFQDKNNFVSFRYYSPYGDIGNYNKIGFDIFDLKQLSFSQISSTNKFTTELGSYSDINNYYLNDFLRVNDSILFIVGPHKSIFVSYNNGTNLEVISTKKTPFKSFFFSNQDEYHFTPLCDVIGSQNGGETYFSNEYDSTVHSVLAKYRPNFPSFNSVLFDSNGKLVCLYPNNRYPNNSPFFLRSWDFGKTFNMDSTKNIIMENDLRYSNLPFFTQLDTSYFLTQYINTGYKKFTNFYTFDSSLKNFTLKVKYDRKCEFVNYYSFNNLFLLNSDLDSTTKINYLKFSFSSDGGETFDDKLIIQFDINNQISNYFLDKGKDTLLMLVNRKVDSLNYQNLILRYVISANKYDTLFSETSSSVAKYFMNYRKKLFVVGNGIFLETKNRTNLFDWQRSDVTGSNWDNVTASDFGFYHVKYSSPKFPEGFYKIYLNDLSSAPEVESEKVYLYNYKPYPIPAVNSVKSLIYWNSSYNIEEAEIGIYDIFGAKLNNINYSIQKLEPFSGNLIVDCSNIPSGVYFARVALGGENLNIPIVVSK